jgi:hypothetical protein
MLAFQDCLEDSLRPAVYGKAVRTRHRFPGATMPLQDILSARTVFHCVRLQYPGLTLAAGPVGLDPEWADEPQDVVWN